MTFTGVVGGTAALTSLTDSSTGITTINNNITTTGIQSYAGPVSLATGPITLTTNSNGNIIFSSTLNGAEALTLTPGSGNVTFTGVVGGTAALSSLTDNSSTTTINNNITTTGAQSYGGTTTLGGNITLTAGNSYGISMGNVNGGSTYSLTIGGGNSVSFQVVGATAYGHTPLSALIIENNITAILNGPVQTTGNQNYSGTVTLGGDRTLTGNTITLGGAVTTTGGTCTLTITGNSVLDGIFTNIVNLSVSGTTTINNNITTTGAQSYAGPVTLATGPITLTTSNSNIIFSSTLNGAEALTLTTGSGNVTFTGIVGGTAALTSLTDSSTGITTINNNITTTGIQSYAGPVSLATGPITLTTNSNGNIIFSSTLNGAEALTLTPGSGNVTFTGVVGGTAALTSLTDSSTGITTINNNITTTGIQSYAGPVSLATGPITLTTNSNGNIIFSSTLNGAEALTLTPGSGSVTFTGIVGGGTPLASLTDSSTGITTINNNITTTGTQSYGGAITLGNDVTLSGTTINLAAVTGGAHNLTITGNTVLSGAFTNVGTFTVSGTSGINTPSISTSGTQGYTDGVTLGNTSSLISSGNISIASATSSSNTYGLTLNATGTLAMGQMGSPSSYLNSLSATGVGGMTLSGNVYTIDHQAYLNSITMFSAPILYTTHYPYTPPEPGHWVTFSSTVTGAYTIFDGFPPPPPPLPPLPSDPTNTNGGVPNIVQTPADGIVSVSPLANTGAYSISTGTYSAPTDPSDSGLQNTSFVPSGIAMEILAYSEPVLSADSQESVDTPPKIAKDPASSTDPIDHAEDSGTQNISFELTGNGTQAVLAASLGGNS